MSFRVSLKVQHPYYNQSWFDPVTGISLTHNTPQSRELTDADNITNVVQGVKVGTLYVSEGVIPQESFGTRFDKTITFLDTSTTIDGGETIQSSVFESGGSVEKTWYMSSGGDVSVTIQLTPDGTNWFDYSVTNINNTEAIISHATVSRRIRISVTNNSVVETTVLVILYARFA